jgi:hypothetical protein
MRIAALIAIVVGLATRVVDATPIPSRRGSYFNSYSTGERQALIEAQLTIGPIV